MAETLFLPQAGSKEEIYQALLPQVEALISGEQDLVANLANIAAALREAFGFFWVGFYLTKENQLVNLVWDQCYLMRLAIHHCLL